MSKIGSAIDKSRKLGLFVTEFTQDMALYFRRCGVSPMQDATSKRYYKLLIEAHAVEKGLSLANPRDLFGLAKVRFLMRELKLYDMARSPFPAEMTLGVLRTYVQVHRAKGVENAILDEIEDFTASFLADNQVDLRGGLRHFEAAYDPESLRPAEFLSSRFSNRIVDSEPLDLKAIEQAVSIAQTAPSQCNRQASQAHFFQDREQISKLLALQSGASGFSETVGNLFVISCDLPAWGGAQQRNQLYVDGSLFAMALIYALHAQGIATCPLNLAVTNRKERAIKIAGKIPAGQRLIMMIAVGRPHTESGLKAAASPRRSLTEVLHIH